MPLKRGCRVPGCLLAVAAAFVLLAGSCHFMVGPPAYYSDDIRARVIVEDTGEPLPGAVVVGVWTASGGVHGSERVLHKAETVTGPDGRFVLPGLPFTIRRPLETLGWSDPFLMIYKPGFGSGSASNYEAIVIGNDDRVLPDGRIEVPLGHRSSRLMKRHFFWNGRDIPVQRPKDFEDEARLYRGYRAYAIENDLSDVEFREYWSALIGGYLRLPPELRSTVTDPRPGIIQDSDRVRLPE